MFSTPLNHDLIKAETAYRRERIQREFHTPTRRERAKQAKSLEPRHARRALRYTKAA